MSTKCLNCERRPPMVDNDFCEPCLPIVDTVLVEMKLRRRKTPRLAKRDWQAPIDWRKPG